jgi:hypothetical protein
VKKRIDFEMRDLIASFELVIEEFGSLPDHIEHEPLRRISQDWRK